MVSSHVVKLAVEYLDQCEAAGQQSTLVGVYWCIDGQNRTIPLLGEVNEALKQRPHMKVSREGGKVTFSAAGSESLVTADDMRRAGIQYRAEFSALMRKPKP